MINPIFNKDNTIRFIEGSHSYYDQDGNQLTSVTRLLNTVVLPFDRKGISARMAMAKAKETRRNPKDVQNEILDEWDAKLKSAEERGNWIHDNFESYALTGKYDKELQVVIEQVQSIFKEAHRFYPEALVYSLRFGTAGQTDLSIQRQRTNKSVFDFWDYKTNEAKGIQFDSISRKKGFPQHYNNFMLAPFDHLEDCNYNRYSLQLSSYAFMAQDTWGIKIGRLGILFIDTDLKVHQVPMPYMKTEAEMLLSINKKLKKLPEENHIRNNQFVPENEDW